MSRETKKVIIDQRIKRVRHLEKELGKIYEAQRELGFILLDKPIRDGWYKSLKLRADIARSKSSNIYQEVLDAVLVEVWGREKKYADKRWNKYFKKYSCNFQRPGIKRLSENEYIKLSSKAKKCFVQRKIREYKGYGIFYACILPRYYFQLNYRRAYLTKLKIISPILESREQEILEFLSSSSLRKYAAYYNYNYRLYDNPTRKERRQAKIKLSKMCSVGTII